MALDVFMIVLLLVHLIDVCFLKIAHKPMYYCI